MQSVLEQNTQVTEQSKQLTTVNYYVDRVTEILDKGGLLKMTGLNSTFTLINTSLMALNNLVSITQAIVHRHLPNEYDVRAFQLERESAERIYDTAQNEFDSNSLKSALHHIDLAITEFTRTSAKKKFFELADGKRFHAEMLYLKGQLLFEFGEYQESSEVLKKVIEKDLYFVGAYNILAVIQLHYFNNIAEAKKYLDQSKHYNDAQIFANFYLSLIAQDHDSLSKVVKNLFELNQMQDLSVEEMSGHRKVYDYLNFKKLTPLMLLPYIFHDWLKYKIEYETNSQKLANAIKSFEDALLYLPLRTQHKHVIMLKEVKVKALFKIVDLKKLASEFDIVDREFLNDNAVQLYRLVEKKENHTYFFEYPIKRIDKTVLRLFSSADISFLKLPMYTTRVGKLIAQCILGGWFREDKNPGVQILCHLAKMIKHAKGVNRKNLITDLIEKCSDSQIINFFVENYLRDKSIETWFQIAPAQQTKKDCALIYLLCEHLNINLYVYRKNETGVAPEKELCQEVLEKPIINQKSLEPEGIHLLFDRDKNKFSLLQELSTPASIYRWSALKLCWELIDKDFNNEVALDYLNKKNPLTQLGDLNADFNTSQWSAQRFRWALTKKTKNEAPLENLKAREKPKNSESRFRFFDCDKTSILLGAVVGAMVATFLVKR